MTENRERTDRIAIDDDDDDDDDDDALLTRDRNF